jgi:folylpolyglutamate synthase/dihydropteroate synthase
MRDKDEDNVRKMPTAVLDNDQKYQNMLEVCLKMNRKTNSKLKCKIFENVLEALMWATESRDANLQQQMTIGRSAYPNHENIHSLISVSEQETQNGQKINVLVTGSLYLVGLALKVLNYKIS